MHILLSDTIDTFQIDATRQMLADFCSLLPELYDEKISTHNVHLFNKICEAMGTTVDTCHENKNRCLKRLFHGKNQIH